MNQEAYCIITLLFAVGSSQIMNETISKGTYKDILLYKENLFYRFCRLSWILISYDEFIEVCKNIAEHRYDIRENENKLELQRQENIVKVNSFKEQYGFRNIDND